jgi:hypothetical protein
MRNVGVLVAVSCLTGVVAAVSCFSTSAAPGSGGASSGGASSSSPAASTGSAIGSDGGSDGNDGAGGTGGTGGSSSTSLVASSAGSGGGGGAGTGVSPLCTGIPATPPSQGSCVPFASDAGVELDAGVNDAGNALETTCNPITNQGCTGTDTCQPDESHQHYFCRPVGPMATAALCQSCNVTVQSCAAGVLCVGSSSFPAECVQMCCTDADCGAGGTCDAAFLTLPLRFGVGICVMN